MSSYSAGIPSSFDPALLLSEYELPSAATTTSFSDEIDALQQCIEDDKAKKTVKGTVIQHRAWNIADVFRSEAEVLTGIASRALLHLGH